jgi:hypothetical protein
MNHKTSINLIKAEAEQVLTVEQFTQWFDNPDTKHNLSLKLGLAHIKFMGYYTCILDNKKTFIS